MMVNISKSSRTILMRFAAHERKFSWPHLEIKIMVIAKYHDYMYVHVMYRYKNLKNQNFYYGICEWFVLLGWYGRTF
jgi:hypothetical protein